MSMLWTLPCVMCVAAAAPAGPTDSGLTPVESPWSTRYFNEQLPLSVDGGWIAVQAPLELVQTQLAATTERWNLNLDQAMSSTVSGWTYIPLTRIATASQIERVVRGISSGPNGLYASPAFLGGTAQLPWIPTSELIVQFADGADLTGLSIIEHDLGGYTGMHRIATDADSAFETLALVESVASRDGVLWAQPNAIWWAQHFYTPNDPMYSSQWALNQSNDMDMDAPECWDMTFGDSSIVVAILDDGIDQDHPDISQIPGADFTDEGTGGDHTTVCDGHGSCVSGCVAATIDNNLGVTGVAPGCRVVAARIFNAIDFFGFCLGFIETTDAWIVNGISWAANNGARVTNSSWGGGSPSSSVTTAFNQTRAAGVVHFGAAGNDSSSNISYPASLASLYAISAINSSGNLASFSTYGNGLAFSAPGEGILTTDWVGSGGFDGGNYVTIDGTSFASPYAAGVAALVLSADASLTPDEVGDIMAVSAMDRGASGYDTSYGYGVVNAAGAVAEVDPAEDCQGDVDGDGSVGTNDLLAVIAAWGACSGCPADINDDGWVGTDDILGVIAAWGSCP
ncbi:MAG: S8 family serine peptidase [Phycisphaerales bacterium]|nr:S8 family serine peptidase [Phycisphaerales bacterium]MDP7188649.1 S8 family serine peptidase [Phycisphaerales bacterium]